MKLITLRRILFLVFIFIISSKFSNAQVKIGLDSVSKDPHPSAVLELSSNNKGFLLPRLSNAEMLKVKDPANGLLIFNKDAGSVFLYKLALKQWQPLVGQQAGLLETADSCEWVYDTISKNVFLRRGLLLSDSIFYSTQAKKFVFTDKIGYNNSLGDPEFPVTTFSGKYYFKGTASRFTDESNLDPTVMNVFMEIDSTGLNSSFSGMQLVAVNNPKNTQVVSSMNALSASTLHSGQDTASFVNGISNATTINGNGYAESVTGLSNSVRISTNSRNDVGTMIGISNSITRSGLATGRVTGDVYGYFGSMNNFANKVDGNLYGIFLNNVTGAGPRQNFAIYTNKGHNRFGDSVLVTDNFAANPRAVFDINSTAAMMLPAGTSVQRPLSALAGMFRYNNTNASPEFYNGSNWLSLGSGNGEWVFDPLTRRVNLVRGLPARDTIFYNDSTRKFVFADRYTNTNSQGSDFPIDAFNAKYTFKGTASQRMDSTQSGGSVAQVAFEVDNDTTTLNGYNSFAATAVMNPKANQHAASLSGISNTTIHAGNDTVDVVQGIVNQARSSGFGKSGSLIGIDNAVRISTNGILNNTGNDAGEMIGFRNIVSRSGASTGRVTGNVYGWQGTFGGFANKVDGSIYGIFLNPVTGAAAGKNFAFYSNNGTSRFGDSVLVTNAGAVNPRAVFDINATSAMILPAGSVAQRPLAGIAGMFRYNNTNASPEFYNGLNWLSLGNSEWVFDPLTRRVNLVRGLPARDTIFYNDSSRKFVFADRYTNTNSQGSDFPIDAFNAKYTFKGTASQRMDSTQSGGSVAQVAYEVDNDTTTLNAYNSFATTAVMNPKANQHAGSLSGMSNTTIHAGNDSVDVVQGIVNQARSSGFGKSGSIVGIDNSVRITTNGVLNNTGNNAGEMIGFRNTVTRSGANTGRVTGNVYGWQGTFGGFANKVDGSIYGIFLNPVTGAAAGKNFAFYSNTGTNRFGDSVLVTNVGAVNPRAVFDINATSAMILPAGSTAQRPVTGIAGMFRYNNTNTSPEFYNGTVWKGLNSDSTEWKYDAATKRVNLVRGLPVKDTVFYNPASRKFVFADRYTNTNSLGQDFPIDAFNGKYTFKGTASQRQDTTQADGPVLNVAYEVDNAAVGTVYNSLQTTAVMNPKANQKADQLSGISNTTIHAGNDSVQAVYGIINLARNSGNGKSGSITGISNSVRITNGVNDNTGDMIGIQTNMSRSGATAGRITGNVYGWQGNFSGFTGKIDGNLYGIYLNGVTGAVAGKNYAFYSNTGTNRFGDSVLITNLGSVNPRAIVDINATSAMIIPTGSAAQRPSTPVQGMLRFNNTTNNSETYTGSQWVGIVRASVTVIVPALPNKGGATVSVSVPGATTGSAVAVSPDNALPAGAIISWTRVSAANTVEIRFENNGSGSLTIPTQNYNIRIIQ